MDMRRGCGIAAGCLGIAVVGGTFGLVIAAHLAGVAFNASADALPEPSRTLWLEDREDDAGRAAAAAVLAEVRGACEPSSNGLRVLFDQAWYNTMTSGYDGRLWFDSERGTELGLYLWGDRVFVRAMKAPYGTQVLACDKRVSEILRLAE